MSGFASKYLFKNPSGSDLYSYFVTFIILEINKILKDIIIIPIRNIRSLLIIISSKPYDSLYRNILFHMIKVTIAKPIIILQLLIFLVIIFSIFSDLF